MTVHERATSERDSTRPRSLMRKPQPLGILPSLWFWQELWRTEPRLHLFFTLLWTMVNAPLVYLVLAYLPPSWLAVSLGFLFPILSMGLVERWLRLLVARRRRLMAARTHAPRGEIPAEHDPVQGR
ncbi:hypothetical protein [Nannocystis radixulma]|uniref:Uncharacterized protein n=1 Tax=Nannocystis radixulma TaxID=2995305 RepID=A0ABT5AXX0_9BACT|nr:hypothetical protein [Nannocystis radixulma]MDC0666310.1 hypothetical protein [Nannocystis radixulma]